MICCTDVAGAEFLILSIRDLFSDIPLNVLISSTSYNQQSDCTVRRRTIVFERSHSDATCSHVFCHALHEESLPDHVFHPYTQLCNPVSQISSQCASKKYTQRITIHQISYQSNGSFNSSPLFVVGTGTASTFTGPVRFPRLR